MKASDWLKTLRIESRERATFEAVRSGLDLPTEWDTVVILAGGHVATLRVGRDVLRIGEPNDFVRVNVTPRCAQWICDLKNWQVPTPRICDAIWDNAAVRLKPCLQPADPIERLRQARKQVGMPAANWKEIREASSSPNVLSPSMADVDAMVKHSWDIEARIAGLNSLGIIETLGKQWVLTEKLISRPGMAANYGWFDAGAPYRSPDGSRPVWQPLGMAHNVLHVDYSQTLRPIHPYMDIDGRIMPLSEVMVHPDLWKLVSYERLSITRIPKVGSP